MPPPGLAKRSPVVKACGGCLGYYASVFLGIIALGVAVYHFQEGNPASGGVALAVALAGLIGAVLLHRQMGSLASVETGTETPEGAEHRKIHPLLCRIGEAGNGSLRAGQGDDARRQYLKVLQYLAARQLIDQFLLGKAYLGLMMVEAQRPGGQLKELVENPAERLTGAMEVAGVMSAPAHHVFKSPMLSPEDHRLYHDLCDLARGNRPEPPQDTMSPWDLALATQESFPVAHLGRNVVATVLDEWYATMGEFHALTEACEQAAGSLEELTSSMDQAASDS